MKTDNVRLAEFIERGIQKTKSGDLPAVVLAVVGFKKGSLEEVLSTFAEATRDYAWYGSGIAQTLDLPVELLEKVMGFNKNGTKPFRLIEMLRSGELGIWPRKEEARFSPKHFLGF